MFHNRHSILKIIKTFIMKNIFIAIVLLLSITNLKAQNTKVVSEFKVEGNCEMCEVRIEKAANSVKGVKKADWDLKTKVIKVTYDSSKTSLDDIHQAISNMGYKTEKLAATKQGYDALPFCCKVNGACTAPKTE